MVSLSSSLCVSGWLAGWLAGSLTTSLEVCVCVFLCLLIIFLVRVQSTLLLPPFFSFLFISLQYSFPFFTLIFSSFSSSSSFLFFYLDRLLSHLICLWVCHRLCHSSAVLFLEGFPFIHCNQAQTSPLTTLIIVRKRQMSDFKSHNESHPFDGL